jgi:serpin B
MSILNKRFSPNPIPQAIRDQIETLRKNLDEANREATEFDKADKKREAYLVSLKAQKIAAELNSLLTHVDQYEIRVANGLWGEKTYPFEPSYLEAVRKFYGPDTIFAVDFKNEAESARLRINQSVEHVTNKRIRDLVPPRAITQTTRLILTNAIYFKGEWQDPFEESLTKPADFTITDGTKLRVAMMYDAYMPGEQYAAFNGDGTFFKTPKEVPSGRDPDPKIVYPDTDGFQILEMPYKGGDLSMIVILPQTADGLDRLEKKLSSKNLQNWAGKLEKRQVYVYLPKFRLEATYAMKETLRSLGMSRSFAEAGSLQGAQFNGMSASRAPEFWISEVLHKAFIEVNEKGTEAAAATCIFWGVSEGAMAEPTRPFDPTFRADRPFLFLIRDIQTGTILFLGRILRPQE